MGAKAAKPRTKNMKAVRTDDIVIPDRLQFRIGDVAKLLKLPTYVLRFWETEFPSYAPKKGSTGQRLYRKRDVENMVKIKKLLYEEGFTIAGAKQHLKTEAKTQPSLFSANGNVSKSELKRVRSGLQDILGILSKKR